MGGVQATVKADKPSFSDHFFRRDKVALNDGRHFLEKAQKAEEGTQCRIGLLEAAVVRLECARRKGEERKFKVTMNEMSCATLAEKVADVDHVISKAAELMKGAYASLAASLRSLPAEARDIFLTYERDYKSIYRIETRDVPLKPCDPGLVIVVSQLDPVAGFAHTPVSKAEMRKYDGELAEFPKKRDEFIELLARKCSERALI